MRLRLTGDTLGLEAGRLSAAVRLSGLDFCSDEVVNRTGPYPNGAYQIVSVNWVIVNHSKHHVSYGPRLCLGPLVMILTWRTSR